MKNAFFRKTLSFAVGLLFLSAVMKLGLNATEAVAKVSDLTSNPVIDAELPKEQPLTPGSLDMLLSELSKRESTILEKEKMLQQKMRTLEVIEEKISEQMAALKSAEQELRDSIALADTAAENDLNRLTRMYENMDPKKTAALFQEMEPKFSAGFLGRMEPNVAASIFDQIDPNVAYAISAILAGRNATVPTFEKQ